MSESRMLVPEIRYSKPNGPWIGVIHEQLRRPTLAEALDVLRRAKERDCFVVIWYGYRYSDDSWNLQACSCGNVAINADSCRFCTALAPLVVSQDPYQSEDIEARYQLSERMLDRIATVVAELKARATAEPGRTAALPEPPTGGMGTRGKL